MGPHELVCLEQLPARGASGSVPQLWGSSSGCVVEPGEVWVGYQGKFLHGRGGQVLEWAATGGGGAPVLGGV